MNALDPFYSPKRRIARAKKHIRDLEGEIKAFLDSKPYARVIEPDAEGTGELHKIKFTKALSECLSDTAVDAVDNLRSALDQAGYAVAVASGRPNAKSSYSPSPTAPPDMKTR